MYALFIGVSRLSDKLPLPVYALLSGLNASVVGAIAFAAVQLADKAITDKFSRLVVVLSACAGLCYNSLWYFPILMILGGSSTVIWDMWARSTVGRLKTKLRRKLRVNPPVTSSDVQAVETEDIVMVSRESPETEPPLRRYVKNESEQSTQHVTGSGTAHITPEDSLERTTVQVRQTYGTSVRVGIITIIAFFSASTYVISFTPELMSMQSLFHCDHGSKLSCQIRTIGAEFIQKSVSSR